MITQEDITKYISSIPPSPKILKEVLSFLSIGELSKAALVAEQDPALTKYMQNIVNKPIYGFKNDISDVKQIFSILGLTQSEQIVYNYMISLLAPNEWELFELTNAGFAEIQDHLGLLWKKILEKKGITDKTIFSSISLLPASIIICEELFKSKQEDINLLRSMKNIDYSTILKRLSGMDLFDLCEKIAIEWELPEVIPKLVLASRGDGKEQDSEIIELSKWMHLLFFYQLSQPVCTKANLNDFIEFKIEFVQDIYEEFQDTVMEDS